MTRMLQLKLLNIGKIVYNYRAMCTCHGTVRRTPSMSFRNKSKDPCKVNACKIQSCLSANNYQESSCLDVLEDMRQCCLKYHDKSLCCSGIKLDKPYLQTADNNGKSSSTSDDISKT